MARCICWPDCSGLGGSLVVLVCLPAIVRLGWPSGLLLSGLAVAELAGVVAIVVRPVRSWLLLTAGAAAGVVTLWSVSEGRRVLPGPDPWVPVDATVGLTSRLCVALQLLTVVTVLAAVALPQRLHRPTWQRLAAMVAAAPVVIVVLLATVAGVVAASNGFSGSPVPATTVAAVHLPAGERSTVEYCRPDGVPLPMDLYLPGQHATRPAPVVLYVHGGGLMLGNRRLTGLGANLAGHEGALFTPVRERLNGLGFVVASIDYRLPPGGGWRAPIEDAKCAVRFLRAHATELGIDRDRIGAWGSSAGGELASLLGLAGPAAGFDHGQYADQPSTVRAVVDMFGPSDVTDLDGSSGFHRAVARLSVGNSRDRRRALSPVSYVAPGAPPFLILHGRQDSDMPVRHSLVLADRLRSAGVPVTLVIVDGGRHGLATPSQRPSPEEVTSLVAHFLAGTLRDSQPGAR